MSLLMLLVSFLLLYFHLVFLTFLMLFTFISCFCISRIFSKFKHIARPNIVQSWQQIHYDHTTNAVLVSVMRNLNNIFCSCSFGNHLLKGYYFFLVLTISSFILEIFFHLQLCCCVICAFACKFIFYFNLTKPLKRREILIYFSMSY